MLDDADATGYIKPRPTADHAKRRAARQSFSRTWRRGGASGGVENSRNTDRRATQNPDDDDDDDNREGGQDGRRRERSVATQKQSERAGSRTRREDGGYDATSAAPSGETAVGVEVAVESSALPGREPRSGKRSDGGRSVLLRRVALSAHDGNGTGADDREGEETAGRPCNAAARREPERQPQPPRGIEHADNRYRGSLHDGPLLTEPPGDSAGSAMSLGKSR